MCLDWAYSFLIEFSNQHPYDCLCVCHKTNAVNQRRFVVTYDSIFPLNFVCVGSVQFQMKDVNEVLKGKQALTNLSGHAVM